MDNYEALWEKLGARRVASSHMDTYRGKASVHDAFIREVKSACGANESGRPLIMAYGSAKFAAGGHGRPAVPTTTAYKRMSLRVKTVLIDEFRTTQRSAFSLKRMRSPKDARGLEMRGFKCCEHNTDLKFCLQGKHIQGARIVKSQNKTNEVWMSRDGNAGLNIRNILARGNRPVGLRRPRTKQHVPILAPLHGATETTDETTADAT